MSFRHFFPINLMRTASLTDAHTFPTAPIIFMGPCDDLVYFFIVVRATKSKITKTESQIFRPSITVQKSNIILCDLLIFADNDEIHYRSDHETGFLCSQTR